MKYAILTLFLAFSGCSTTPNVDHGLWSWEELVLQEDLKASREANKALKREIRYLKVQLKEAYKAARVQEKIYRQ